MRNADKQVFSDVDRVRMRPGMYVGNTEDGSGYHHLLWEVLGNALDQFLAGKVTLIDVTLENDFITVADDGPGIPLAPDPNLW